VEGGDVIGLGGVPGVLGCGFCNPTGSHPPTRIEKSKTNFSGSGVFIALSNPRQAFEPSRQPFFPFPTPRHGLDPVDSTPFEL